MTAYNVALKTGKAIPLKRYNIRKEVTGVDSIQKIVASNPQIVLGLPELEVQSDEVIVCREFSTSRGSIDILILTPSADIILIETKLFKNPESSRTVVAQTIDYAKAFSMETVDDLIRKLRNNASVENSAADNLVASEHWISNVQRNLSSGNYKIVILGDRINSNILGMVESIQAAPHLAFTIYMVEIDPFICNDESITLYPRIVTNTLEVERSVVKISVDLKKEKYSIDSEAPEKGGKGSKQILTREEYLELITIPKFRSVIQSYWRNWEEIGGDLRFGVAGFSSGINFGGRRIPVQLVYHTYMEVITERWVESYNIPETLFADYKEDLKKSQQIYDKFVTGKKVLVRYNQISDTDLQVLLDAALNLGKKMKQLAEE